MIVLLNLLVAAVIVGASALAFKIKKFWPIYLAVAFVMVYNIFQPSYMPKGEVHRAPIPAFEKKDVEIQDRLLKPKSGDERDVELKAKIVEGLPGKPIDK